jgi:serine/threonine protein kinase
VDGGYCLLLDWLPGIDLAEYLKWVQLGKTPRPDPIECIRLFRGLAHSLRLLHDVAQVVHGDLKPQNVILTRQPISLRMIDFGSSWQIDRTRDRVAGDGSDPLFTAPEFYLDSSPVGPASDQFSLGVMLYLMLTQCLPYGGIGGKVGHPDFQEAFASEIEPPSGLLEAPREIPEGIRREIDVLVLTMLQVNPEERYSNSRVWTSAFDKLHSRVLQARHADPGEPSPLGEALGWLIGIGRKISGRGNGSGTGK